MPEGLRPWTLGLRAVLALGPRSPKAQGLRPKVSMIVYGVNPVLEALRAGRVTALRVGPRQDARVAGALRLAAAGGVAVERVDARVLDQQAEGGAHQGLVAVVKDAPDYSLSDLLDAARGHAPLIVVLDGVDDPHNFGAIVRSVDASGADGLVR